MADHTTRIKVTSEADTGGLDKAEKSLDDLQREARETEQAMRRAAIGSDEFTAAQKRLKEQKAALAAATGKVTASNTTLRTSFTNVGYQVQDFAVQVGSGTSAVRAFSQQAPQLLSALGPWGVALGTVVALGAPLAAQLLGQGDAAENAAGKTDQLKETLEKYADAEKEAALARDLASLDDWLEALDAEEEKVRRSNEALEASIQLQIKLQSLRDGVQSARRSLAAAEIQADPNLSAADKTRALAQIEQAEARQKAQSQIAGYTNAAETAGRSYDASQKQADADAAALKQAEDDRRKTESGIAESKRQQEEATKRIPELEKKLKDAESDLRQARIGAQGNLGADAERRFSERIQALRSELSGAKTSAGADLTPEQRDERRKQQDAELAKKQATEQQAADAAKKSAAAAEKAYAEMLRKQAEARESIPFVSQRYEIESQTRTVETEARARQQEQEEERRKRDAEASARRQAEEQRLREQEEAFRSSTRGAGANFTDAGRRVGGPLADSLQTIGSGLSDGSTDQAELARLSAEFEAATKGLGGATIESLRAMLAAQKQLAAEVENIKGQIRNNRSGK